MVCNVLKFVDASPLTLFDSSGTTQNNGDSSSDDVFESFLSCVISSNEAIRQLAGRVATRHFADRNVLDALRSRGKLSSSVIKPLRRGFWRRRQATLVMSILRQS